MPVARETKPVLDAVNDTIGTLSDLLHSLRVHAKEAAAEAKVKARIAKASATKAGKGAVKAGKKAGKKAVGKVAAAGDGILDKAAKVWHDITGTDEAESATLTVRRTPSKK